MRSPPSVAVSERLATALTVTEINSGHGESNWATLERFLDGFAAAF